MIMHNVLVIEDDVDFQKLVADSLQQMRMISQVFRATTIREARATLESSGANLILLDVGLPDGEGFKFCAELQQDSRWSQIPVIFVTGRGSTDDKVLAFSLGAEDYIIKPFDRREFCARVFSKLQKINKDGEQQNQELRVGDLRLLLIQQQALVRRDGREESLLELTPFEFKLLCYLARHNGQVLTRDQILLSVWGENAHVVDRNVDSQMSNLRKKLANSSCKIQSVYGEGYRFVNQG